MFLDLFNLTKIRRALIYAALMIIYLCVECGIFPRLPIFGVRLIFTPCFIIAVAMFEGEISGGIFGLILGILLDIKHTETVVLFTIYLPILGYAAGVVTNLFVNRRFFSFTILSAAALVGCALLQGADLLLFSADTDKLRVLTVAGLQVLLSLPLTVLIYPPCRAASRHGREEK